MARSQSEPKKPADTAFKQQRLRAWKPVLTPCWISLFFFAIGIPFVFYGNILRTKSADLEEMRIQYDGPGTSSTYSDCQITRTDEGATCTVSFTAEADMKAPVYVYYQLEKYYQNHRNYVKSYSTEQLLGCTSESQSGCSSLSLNDCYPLKRNGSQYLSPCGLVANSLFNDKITLSSSQSVSYDGIAWPADADKFKQPEGFKAAATNYSGARSCYTGSGYPTCDDDACTTVLGSSYTGCKVFKCTEPDYFSCTEDSYYLFYYPKDSTTQYLYESFPQVVSPVKGVESERFHVWMRTATLPKFRKQHAKITEDIQKGDVVSFSVTSNFDVSPYKGSKSLIIATTDFFGTQNAFLGNAFIGVGVISLILAIPFMVKALLWPRKLGDTTKLE